MPGIETFLWFDRNAEEAVHFYQSVFRDCQVLMKRPYPPGSPGPEGELMLIRFELLGQRFAALNGGPGQPFTHAISLSIDCRDQEEIDYYWERLCDGGKPVQCGWLVDRFGLSWQVVPKDLPELFDASDAKAAERVMKAMMGMVKLDLAELKRARAAA